MTLLLREDHIQELNASLQKIPSDSHWYSDPRNKDYLPFPFLYTRLPTERFRFRDSSIPFFEYMGREPFSELLANVLKLKVYVGYSQLYIQGTMGYGKSHILAALACLLHRLGKRVVYLPDCRQMLVDPVSYIRSALLCTFSDSSLSSQRRRNNIRFLVSHDKILCFCRGLLNMPMYFIVDQLNALEQESADKDEATNSAKLALSRLLQNLYLGHYSITSASANYRTARYMKNDQTGEIKMSMIGGLSRGSMAHSFSSCCNRTT